MIRFLILFSSVSASFRVSTLGKKEEIELTSLRMYLKFNLLKDVIVSKVKQREREGVWGFISEIYLPAL